MSFHHFVYENLNLEYNLEYNWEYLLDLNLDLDLDLDLDLVTIAFDGLSTLTIFTSTIFLVKAMNDWFGVSLHGSSFAVLDFGWPSYTHM